MFLFPYKVFLPVFYWISRDSSGFLGFSRVFLWGFYGS